MVDVCPIQLPGRENRLREAAWTQINRIAEVLSAELWAYFDRPYILYGYSWGDIIAFELSRQLRRLKVPSAVSLYALAQTAPHLPQTRSPLRHLPDDLFLLELRRRYNGMAAAIVQNRELMQLLLPTLRADITALETYKYCKEEPLECTIRAFGGTFDLTTTEGELRAWQQHTKKPFELTIFQGNHFFIHNNQASVLETIVREIPGNSVPQFW